MRTQKRDLLKHKHFLAMILISLFCCCKKLFTHTNTWMIEQNEMRNHCLRRKIFMGLPSKATSTSNIYLKDKNEIAFNDTKNCFIFKSFFSNPSQNLVSKLLPSPNAFTESNVVSYYGIIKFKDLDFHFSEASPEKVLNILNIKYLKY